jgi:hypothetical protein
MRKTMASLLVAGLALSLATEGAAAKTRHRVAPRVSPDGYIELPLTVNKRSFLDPGPVAPVGTGANYVAASTIFNRTPDQNFDTARFGNTALPGQPYVPGRTVPVVEFGTGPRVGDLSVGPFSRPVP